MQTALLSWAPPVIIHAAPTASPRATCRWRRTVHVGVGWVTHAQQRKAFVICVHDRCVTVRAACSARSQQAEPAVPATDDQTISWRNRCCMADLSVVMGLAADPRVLTSGGVPRAPSNAGISSHLAVKPRRLASRGVLTHKPHAPADQQVQALGRVVLPAAVCVHSSGACFSCQTRSMHLSTMTQAYFTLHSELCVTTWHAVHMQDNFNEWSQQPYEGFSRSSSPIYGVSRVQPHAVEAQGYEASDDGSQRQARGQQQPNVCPRRLLQQRCQLLLPERQQLAYLAARTAGHHSKRLCMGCRVDQKG